MTNAFKTYWASAPLSLPFAKGRVLLDLMPGFQVDLERGPAKTTAWSFTHSSRVAVYGIVPQSALVGEMAPHCGTLANSGATPGSVRACSNSGSTRRQGR